MCPKCNKDIANEQRSLNLPDFAPDPPFLLGALTGDMHDSHVGLAMSGLSDSSVMDSGLDISLDDTGALELGASGVAAAPAEDLDMHLEESGAEESMGLGAGEEAEPPVVSGLDEDLSLDLDEGLSDEDLSLDLSELEGEEADTGEMEVPSAGERAMGETLVLDEPPVAGIPDDDSLSLDLEHVPEEVGDEDLSLDLEEGPVPEDEDLSLDLSELGATEEVQGAEPQAAEEDLSLDLEDLTEEVPRLDEMSGEGPDAATDDSLSLDLEEGEDEMAVTEQVPAVEVDQGDDSLSLDLEEGPGEEALTAEVASADMDLEEDSLALDIEDVPDDQALTAEMPSGETGRAEEESLALDLEDLEETNLSDAASPAGEEGKDTSDDLEFGDLSLEEDEGGAEASTGRMAVDTSEMVTREVEAKPDELSGDLEEFEIDLDLEGLEDDKAKD